VTVMEALLEGVGTATRHWRALLLIWAVNLLLAVPLTLWVGQSVDEELAHTESAPRMAEGFDWLWYQEFHARHSGEGDPAATLTFWQQGAAPVLRNFEHYVIGTLRSGVPGALLASGLIYLLLTTFLTGGLLGLFSRRDSRFTFRFFFDRAGRHFLGLLGVLVVAQLLYLLVWRGLGVPLRGLVTAGAAEATTEWTPVLLDWGTALVLLILVLGVHMTMNFARVALVAWEKLGLGAALVGAVMFTFRNLRRASGLFGAITLLAVVLFGVWSLLAGLGGGGSIGDLLLLALVQQLFIVGSIWIRAVYLAGQMTFYRGAMNLPDFVTPAGPPPDGDQDRVEVETAALTG
jgi:hypothetical protein